MHYLRILDRGTDIFVGLFVLEPKTDEHRRLMDRGGWGEDPTKDYLFLVNLSGDKPKVQWDPWEWDGGRTITIAHSWLTEEYAAKGWDHLLTIDVIDVEFIKGEKPKPRSV